MLCSTAELAARWTRPGRSLFAQSWGLQAPCRPWAQAVPAKQAQKAWRRARGQRSRSGSGSLEGHGPKASLQQQLPAPPCLPCHSSQSPRGHSQALAGHTGALLSPSALSPPRAPLAATARFREEYPTEGPQQDSSAWQSPEQQSPPAELSGISALRVSGACTDLLLPPGSAAFSKGFWFISGERKRDSWIRWNRSPSVRWHLQEAILVKDMDKAEEVIQALELVQGPPSSKQPLHPIYPERGNCRGSQGEHGPWCSLGTLPADAKCLPAEAGEELQPGQTGKEPCRV